MAKLDWRTRLNTAWRERVFLTAARQFAKSRPASLSFGALVAYAIATLVFLATFLFAVVGIYLILFDFPNILAGLLGALFLALAYLARPILWSSSVGQPRGSFPVLEEALDQISDELGAPRIKTIELTSDWNAAVWQSFYKRESHLILGMSLLYSAPNPARTAILAHEIAHLVNGDPQRGNLIAAARQTISEWLEIFGYDEVTRIEIEESNFKEALRQAIAFILLGLRALMDRSNFYESQTAEYLADGLSKKVAGEGAMQEALLHISTSFHLNRSLKTFIPVGDERGLEALEFLRHTSRLSEEVKQERTELINKTLVRSDTSHPPTAYRIAFLETLGPMECRVEIDDATWEKIEKEFEPYLEFLGSEMLSRRQVSIH